MLQEYRIFLRNYSSFFCFYDLGGLMKFFLRFSSPNNPALFDILDSLDKASKENIISTSFHRVISGEEYFITILLEPHKNIEHYRNILPE